MQRRTLCDDLQAVLIHTQKDLHGGWGASARPLGRGGGGGGRIKADAAKPSCLADIAADDLHMTPVRQGKVGGGDLRSRRHWEGGESTCEPALQPKRGWNGCQKLSKQI